jgi:hypothetical protein
LQELGETRTGISKVLKDFTMEKVSDAKIHYDSKRKAASQTDLQFSELKQQDVFYDAIEEEPTEISNTELKAISPSFSLLPSRV